MGYERRRLVVGFGVNQFECGWAATANLINYELKRRSGEWESAFVCEAGRVQQLIVAPTHDEAVALRERLNNEPNRVTRSLVEARGLPRPKVTAIQLLLEIAWALEGLVDAPGLTGLVWQIVVARDDEIPQLRKQLDELSRSIDDAVRRSGWWSELDDFPFTAVVFDLDDTLVDSSGLKTPDDRRAWADADDIHPLQQIDTPGGVAVHELPGLLSERGVPVAVVTRSPRRYAERVIDVFGIQHDGLYAGTSNKVDSLRAYATDLGVPASELVLIGDDESDIVAARTVGGTSLGLWRGPGQWRDRLQPDITIVEPALLLRVADWWQLAYLAEQENLEIEPVLHAGSWITYGGLQTYALGRYFTTRSARGSEALSRTILRGKDDVSPDLVVARALRLLGSRINTHALVDLVTSVPASNGKPDRFADYRTIVADAFEADSDVVLSEVRAVGSLKRMTHEARAKANKDRFVADASVEGLHVLVIDDVITSGTTLAACVEALHERGASEVSCVAFAGTQD